MTTKTTALVWFRRDLRLADNPALAAAARHADQIVAVYVHAPEEDGAWRPGAASDWWLHLSLARLDGDLRRRGIALTLRRGPSSAGVLAELAIETGATHLYWNRLYEPAIEERDRRLEAELGASGLACESFNAALICEPWELLNSQQAPYRVFTPFWRACQARLHELPGPLPAPQRLRGPSPPGETLDGLGLLPTIAWDHGLAERWSPGEAGAHERLDAFCESALAHYGEGRNRPDADDGSRLSPHLHFGEVSPRQCVVAVRNALAERPAAAQPSAEAFLRQLGWREFAHHLLHHFPHTTDAPLDERFERFDWQDDAARLQAWQRGRTGYPLVDAGMRELWRTGWMHNRVRMVVASLLVKNLRQPWIAGARWFWDTLVDADLANNALGWQWTAGCGADAAPYFRIFNPVLQAERHDPRRVYLRRWLPELAQLPDEWIHRPWQAPAAVLAAAGVELGVTYPRPIVDFAESRREALDAYARIREPATREATAAPRRRARSGGH